MSTRLAILAADVHLEQRLEFARSPSGWGAVASVVVLLGLLYVVFFLYRREQRAGASMRRRMVLASLRALVILVLAAVWLEPVLATYIHRRVESYTLVLLDSSASMGLHDRYPNAADAHRIERALAGTDTRRSRRPDPRTSGRDRPESRPGPFAARAGRAERGTGVRFRR